MELFIHFFLSHVKDCIFCPYFWFGVVFGAVASYFYVSRVLSRGTPISEDDRAYRLALGRSQISEHFKAIKKDKDEYDDAYHDINYYLRGTVTNRQRRKILNLVRKAQSDGNHSLLDKAIRVLEDS